MESKFKIFVIVAIVILGIAIAGSTFFVLKTLNASQDEKAVIKEEAVQLTEVAIGEAIMTNITSEGSVPHFAKIQIKLGINSENTKLYDSLISLIQTKSASIRNELINAIGEQTYSMLSDTKNGKEKLADEIITRLNKLLETEMIHEVYYEEYFVQ